MRYYTLSSNNEPQGPVSMETIDSSLKSGTLSLESLVCPEGGKEWIALKMIMSQKKHKQKSRSFELRNKLTYGLIGVVVGLILPTLFSLTFQFGRYRNPENTSDANISIQSIETFTIDNLQPGMNLDDILPTKWATFHDPESGMSIKRQVENVKQSLKGNSILSGQTGAYHMVLGHGDGIIFGLPIAGIELHYDATDKERIKVDDVCVMFKDDGKFDDIASFLIKKLGAASGVDYNRKRIQWVSKHGGRSVQLQIDHSNQQVNPYPLKLTVFKPSSN